MKNLSLIPFFLLLIVASAWAQNGTQTIKGTIIDQQSQIPLIGVAVELLNETDAKGVITDIDGRFMMKGVSVGRHDLRISYLGYSTLTIPNVVVTSGKEAILNIGLEESLVAMDEVVVTAKAEKDRATNELATVSARSFDLEEVTRYSGGRNDVARLVGNFAGVAVADDSRNDIVIRGNSPTGVLWRLEGIPIPNPNHFSTLGATGGPVSALNPNLLSTSDFMTSAFPAEYGNATAGVFDIGFRSGNRDRFEYNLQLGAFSGLEAMVEGPLSNKNNSSFIASYRHSFVELADAAGIPVGTNATPSYRDLSFKVDFANGKAGKLSLFGIGGLSKIDFLASETDENDLFADADEDSYYNSHLGIVGLRHNLIIGKDAYVRTVVSASSTRQEYEQDNYFSDGEKLRVIELDNGVNTYAVSSFWNKKFNARTTLRAGVLAEYFNLNINIDDREGRPDLDNDGEPDWQQILDFNDGIGLTQAYVQTQYKVNQSWTINAGLHTQYLGINESVAVEPRLALNWEFLPNHRLNLGYGLHHQMQPLAILLNEEEIAPNEYARTNEHLDFTRSNHLCWDMIFVGERIGVLRSKRTIKRSTKYLLSNLKVTFLC